MYFHSYQHSATQHTHYCTFNHPIPWTCFWTRWSIIIVLVLPYSRPLVLQRVHKISLLFLLENFFPWGGQCSLQLKSAENLVSCRTNVIYLILKWLSMPQYTYLSPVELECGKPCKSCRGLRSDGRKPDNHFLIIRCAITAQWMPRASISVILMLICVITQCYTVIASLIAQG